VNPDNSFKNQNERQKNDICYSNNPTKHYVITNTTSVNRPELGAATSAP